MSYALPLAIAGATAGPAASGPSLSCTVRPAKHVYAIVLGPEKKKPHKGDYTKAISILVRTFGLFQHNVGVTDVEIANEVAKAKNAKIKYIRPKSDLPTPSLGIDPAIQDRMWVLGKRAAREAGKIT